jgi:hypothetical protein
MKYLKYFESYNSKYPNINAFLKISTPSDFEEVSDIEYKKLDIIKNWISFSKVEGKIDQDDGIVDLYFTVDGKSDFTINGLWDDKTEKLNSIFKLKNIEIDFNYHPLNSMGGFNEEIFRKHIIMIFELINDPHKYEIYKLTKKAKKYNIL